MSNNFILNNGNSIVNFETEEYDLIYITINQKLFNLFNTDIDFYDFILFQISEIYRLLKNYKIFSIKIENIYNSKNKNIKWDLYSKLTIFSENS